MKDYLFEYYHDGSLWTITIRASSMEDAQARINKLPYAKPLGELIATIPASVGFMARWGCALRNLLFPQTH